MKFYITASFIALGAIALFYSQFGKEKEKVIKNKWPTKYETLVKNKLDQNKSLQSKKTAQKIDKIDPTLPPDLQKVAKKVHELSALAVDVDMDMKEFENQIEYSSSMMENEMQEANQIVDKLVKQGLINKEKIEKEIAIFDEPLPQSQMPPEIKKPFVEAKKSTIELEKTLKAIQKLQNEGE